PPRSSFPLALRTDWMSSLMLVAKMLSRRKTKMMPMAMSSMDEPNIRLYLEGVFLTYGERKCWPKSDAEICLNTLREEFIAAQAAGQGRFGFVALMQHAVNVIAWRVFYLEADCGDVWLDRRTGAVA